MQTITTEDVLISRKRPAGDYNFWSWDSDSQEWVYAGDEFREEEYFLDAPASIAYKALANQGDWSEVYYGLDNLYETEDVRIGETTGWTDLRLDDCHFNDWRENHSFYLT